jgi:uncharacterized membrane protein HdeD (DUF308 family)
MSPGLRIAFSVVGVLTCLVGAVFFLQGVGVLGGSFMSHTTTWTVIGAAMVAGGLILLSLLRPKSTGGTGPPPPA